MKIQLIFSRLRSLRNNHGLTLIELTIAVFILGLAIVPMMDAFGSARQSVKVEEQTTVFAFQAMSTLSRIADLDYDDLLNNQGNSVDLSILFGSPTNPKPDEAAKESFILRGETYIPEISIAHYTDPDTGEAIAGALVLTARIQHVSLTNVKVDH
jgi:prepilin-type N-terminal cleavage/methylation domain-containing protein